MKHIKKYLLSGVLGMLIGISAFAQNKEEQAKSTIKSKPASPDVIYVNGVPAVKVIRSSRNKEALYQVAFKVNEAYPNPFTKETRISYRIPQDGVVNITVRDVNGKVVKSFRSSATDRAVVWDGSGSSDAGVYFCTLEYAGMKKTIKLVKVE